MTGITNDNSVAIIGAGPAGLTSAHHLAKHGFKVTIIESDPLYLGGIARTVSYKGFSFDIGGHRFFSKSNDVRELWSEFLPGGMLVRSRCSRIFYQGKFYPYPIEVSSTLKNLGIVESTRCVLSYGKSKFFFHKTPVSFEDWVTKKFGTRLFNIFFKTYTEKVWGLSCNKLSSDWAAQRIRGLSLGKALKNALFPTSYGRGNGKKSIKTLATSFLYPRKGPGMLWENCGLQINKMGGRIIRGEVFSCQYDSTQKYWTVLSRDKNGAVVYTKAKHMISSMPLRNLATIISPTLSDVALQAARSLEYRDLIVVALIVRDRGFFKDQWIYIHDLSVKVARIQNFKAWSIDMVPDTSLNCYGMEYFTSRDDGFWKTPDSNLIALATAELVRIGLAQPDDILDGYVVRQPYAYPVYKDNYGSYVRMVREELEGRFCTLYSVGRNGMHRYNNMDHSMITGKCAAQNILLGYHGYDAWKVNDDAQYLEAPMLETDTHHSSPQSPVMAHYSLRALTMQNTVDEFH